MQKRANLYLFTKGIAEGPPDGPIGTGAVLSILHVDATGEGRNTHDVKVAETEWVTSKKGSVVYAELLAAVDALTWARVEHNRHGGMPATMYTDSMTVVRIANGELTIGTEPARTTRDPEDEQSLAETVRDFVEAYEVKVLWCPEWANRARYVAQASMSTALGMHLPGWILRGGAPR